MSTARVILRQNGRQFRLLRFETMADGSIAVLVDRDPDVKRGGLRFDGTALEADPHRDGEIAPHGKFSCHVTGQINRWASGVRKHTHFVEPLTRLTLVHQVGVYSIPTVTRLNPFNSNSHGSDTTGELEVPDEITGRLNFAIEIAPKGHTAMPSYGVSLGYELYSLVVRFIEFGTPEAMKDHFVEASPVAGHFAEKQMGIPEAEIEFYRTAYPGVPPVFREDGGAYVVMAAVPMRVPPKLLVEFARSDLTAEQISIDGSLPTHKVKFWIRDKGGRNKNDDLRPAITSIALDAEFDG